MKGSLLETSGKQCLSQERHIGRFSLIKRHIPLHVDMSNVITELLELSCDHGRSLCEEKADIVKMEGTQMAVPEALNPPTLDFLLGKKTILLLITLNLGFLPLLAEGYIYIFFLLREKC